MSNGAFFIIRCSQSLPAISLTVSFSHNFDQHRRNKATTASQIRPRSATLLLALLLTGRMSATSACNGLTLAGHACMCQHAVHSPRPVTRPRSHLRLRDLHQHKAAQSRRQRAPALKKGHQDLDVGWMQTTDEAHLLVPTEQDVHKEDISFQVHPKRLTLTVKGESLLSGDLPEAVDIDGSFWVLEDTIAGRMIHIILEKQVMGHESWPSPIEAPPEPNADADASVTHRTFFELTIGDKPLGRVVFGLFGNALPKTVENFRALCAGDKGHTESGIPLHYKGSIFHRVIPSFMVQGGDFTQGNGRGGESIYGRKFNDEGFPFKHTTAGQLSMANAGPNTNGSQFFITLGAHPHLDGKHMVFGQVESGMEFVQQIEALGSTESGSVSDIVTISDCGEVS